MKLSGQKAKSYLADAKPSPITLIFGENTARARQTLKSLVAKYLGENANEEMRLTELDAREAQKDPALIYDALRSISFFAGPRGVVIFNATDALAKVVETALIDRTSDDAELFIQAGNLKASSKLRKALEGHNQAAVIGLYEDPLSPQEVVELVKTKRLRLTQDAQQLLNSFALSYDRSALEPLIDRLALYQGDDPEALSVEGLQQLLPGQNSQTADEIINAIFRGDAKRLVEEVRRAPAQGISLTEINMRAIWRAKLIFELKSARNPSQAMQNMRPPLFGARKQALEDNIRRWSAQNAEQALKALSDAEKEIRSGRVFLPERAFLERVFLRVALYAR